MGQSTGYAGAGARAAGLFLRGAGLEALFDLVAVRDPAGRSRRPHLVPFFGGGEHGFLARGPFLIQERFVVSNDDGMRFCRATGDANPIHFEGSVVPGAYTAAKVLLSIEVVFPELDLAKCSVRFTSIAAYGSALGSVVRCEPQEWGASFRARVTFRGVPVAEVEVEARRSEASPPVQVARRKVNVERLRAVRAFVRSLHVAPHAYFRRASRLGYFYPRAYLAALPSGAMVRHFRGEGGLLNRLCLEFDPELRIPIAGREGPEVELDRPRARRTFNRILAVIKDSLRTYVRGSAIVFLRGGAQAPKVEPGTEVPSLQTGS